MTRLGPVAVVLALLSMGCGDQVTGGPLPRPDTPPGRLLSFSGTLQPRGLDSYPFLVTRAGEVEITLLGASLLGVTPVQAVSVGLGIGTATAGGGCALAHVVTAQGGPTAQITGTGQAGTLCASVFDVGNLTAPAIYTITVATP